MTRIDYLLHYLNLLADLDEGGYLCKKEIEACLAEIQKELDI